MNAIPTFYKGIQFRSRLEAKWAAFFDALLWTWEYEPFDANGWIPDFAIKPLNDGPLVLVEVKPVDKFPLDVAKKIDSADDQYEVVIVGLGPMRDPRTPYEVPRLGWLGEYQGAWFPNDWPEEKPVERWWQEACFGIWVGSESRNKNPLGLIGFCASDGQFRDRITGCYDGGNHGDGTYEARVNLAFEIGQMWATAGNKVQWRKPERQRFTGGINLGGEEQGGPAMQGNGI